MGSMLVTRCHHLVTFRDRGQDHGDVDGGGDDNAPQEGQGSEEIIALDAVSLYPSITREVAMEMCRQAALETEIEIKHMNLLEATRLLVLMWPREKTEKSSIKRYLPVRRVEPGKRVGKLGHH